MTDKGKHRLKKSLAKRKKERLNRAWRNIFVKFGYLKDAQLIQTVMLGITEIVVDITETTTSSGICLRIVFPFIQINKDNCNNYY
ncbi:hypothetical protein ACFQ9Y_26555 [Peribacillus simplex]|uniref:hypothetical protein n=1 Tax=Peribacillus simplex TaxID=1478 RepID=UPI003670E9E8